MALHLKLKPTSAIALAMLLAAHAGAQTTPASLGGVTITSRAAPVLDAERADVGGLGLALSKTPQSLSVIGADLLAATGTASLSQVVKLDASLADSYNTTGYIESLSVRGFLLDQGSNYLRNGLGVSNYAPIALENKGRVEVLKGVAGLQAGVSAPGGLVNFVTKTPQADAFTTVTLGANDNGGSTVHLDSNTRWGTVGVRVNLLTEALRPQFDHAQGSRELASMALASSLSPDTTVSADLEYHHKKQASVPGLGLLDTNGDGVGDTLPAHINPHLNLNNQAWSLPFEATATTAQLALQHQLNPDWKTRVGLSAQRTVIDDRIAFPDGCSNAATYVYPGLCANGDVDVYDYRSEGEVRTTWSWDARLEGKASTWGLTHHITGGLSGRAAQADLPAMQAYNYVGSTNMDAPTALPADATLSDLNTNSRERTLDAYASIVTDLGATVQSFAGLRTTHVVRSSARSDGSRPLAYEQTISAPWLALAWSVMPTTLLYASWGQGMELEAVPNRPKLFANSGAVLPALKSEQTEIGVKWQVQPRLLLTATLFSIDKPYADDQQPATGLPVRMAGGKVARHRGLELTAWGQLDAQWSVQSSLTLLDARFSQALDPTLVDQAITNLPRTKATVFGDYKIAALPGLAVSALMSYESGKTASANGSVTLPDAWQLDAGLRLQNRFGGHPVLWRLNVENLTDRNYWREAPTQSWGGVYLFTSTPRTVRAGVTFEF